MIARRAFRAPGVFLLVMGHFRALTIALSILAAFALPASASAAFGDLDASFGTGGKVRLDSDKPYTPIAIRVQPDGKILIGLSSYVNTSEAQIRRLLPNGAVDTSFGDQGVVKAADNPAFGDMEILADGRIVWLTHWYARPANTSVSRLEVLTADGKPDGSFAGTGSMELSRGKVGLRGGSLAVQTGSKILISGSLDGSTTATSVIRLDASGARDETFGTAGTLTVHGYESMSSGITVAPSGDIYLGLDRKPSENSLAAAHRIARFSADGERRMQYGTDGVATVWATGSSPWGVSSIAVTDSGALVATAKGFWPGSKGGSGPTYHSTFLSPEGKQILSPYDGYFVYGSGAAALPGSGLVMTAGSTLGAFRDDLSSDRRFDGNGFTDVSVGTCNRWGPIDSYPDGSIVTAGYFCGGIAVTRLLGTNGGEAAPQPRLSSTIQQTYWQGKKSKSWLRSVSGVANPKGQLQSVGIAIRREDKKLARKGRCRWMTSAGTSSRVTRAENGRCVTPVFMRAAGLEDWKFKLRRPLGLGSYRLYIRATNRFGAYNPLNDDSDTYVKFRVRKVKTR